MKTKFALFATVFFGFHAYSAPLESLVGQWKLTEVTCEDGRTRSAESQAESAKTISSGVYRDFFALGKSSTRLTVPSEQNSTVSCPVAFESRYDVSADQKVLTMTIENIGEESACYLGDKMTAEDFNKAMKGQSISYAMKLTDQNMSLSQPLKEGQTEFDCGPDVHVVEVWQKVHSDHKP